MYHTTSSPAPATLLVPTPTPASACMGGKARMLQLITSWESWRAGELKWSWGRRGRVTALHLPSSEPVVRTLHNTTQHNTPLTASPSHCVTNTCCALHYDEICCAVYCCLAVWITQTPFNIASSHLYRWLLVWQWTHFTSSTLCTVL